MKSKLPLALLILLLAGVYWLWWLPGPRVATDSSLISQSLLKSYLTFPQTWSTGGTEGLGEYSVFTLWSWPFNFLYSLFANLGLSFNFLQRFFLIIPFLAVGALGIWKICGKIKLSYFAAGMATFFYLTNTYVLLLIDGGQLTIGLAYALFPLGFLLLEKAIEGKLRQKIYAGLLISAIGVFDIRFLFVFAILGFIRFIFEFFFLDRTKWAEWIVNWLKTGLTISLLVVGLNAYWIIVLIKYPLSAGLYNQLTQTSFTSLISLGNALFLFSPHWFQNVFGRISPLHLEFILIPILVFAAAMLRRKDKFVGFWLVVAVLSTFLTKGASEPFSGIYPWLYGHIPGFSLFRDSSKFFFLIALSYSLLLGVTLDEIQKRLRNPKLFIVFIAVLIIYLTVLIRPVWSGLMTGTFSPPPFIEEYSRLNKSVAQDPVKSNVLWIPTIAPLTVLNTDHPAVDATRLALKRPFVQANLGTYELFNFLREAPYMGELFNVSNIGYIAYPRLDLRRANLHPDNIRYYYTFLRQLSKLPWLSRVENSPVPLFKVKNYQDKLFMVSSVWAVLGSDSVYSQATASAKLSLSKNAFIFLEESPDLVSLIDKIPSAKIIRENKSELDLAADLIDSQLFIFPAKQLQDNPDSSGWWKRDTASWFSFKDFLRTKYAINLSDFDLGGGWAVGEGEKQFSVFNFQFSKGKHLLVRVMESSRSGTLKFYQDGQAIGEVLTRNEGNTNVRWFDVGILRDDSAITIAAAGDINLVNVLAVISKDKWQEFQNRAAANRNRVTEFKPENTEENTASLSYRQISPTEYTVVAKNLTKPQVLVFSQNYDNRWQLNGQQSFPVYSFLNGFYVEKDGQYKLEFAPQKYVPAGLGISVLTLLVALVLLVV